MISLVKGQTIDLKKSDSGSDNNLSQVTIGLGWDINKSASGNYDLDACAVLLNKEGKLESDSDIVSFRQLKHNSGNIYLTGDNVTGQGDGDDEQIIVNLERLDPKYDKIVFYTTIYSGASRNQEFSMVENAYIRAVDGNKKEIAKYPISGDSSLRGKRSFVFAEVYRRDGSWKFRALGEAHDTDNLSVIAEGYKAKKRFGIF